MAYWDLNREGFVCHYMVTGPVVSDLTCEMPDSFDQLNREIAIRSIIAEHRTIQFSERLEFSKKSRIGRPWRFIGGRDGAFVNLSEFYSQMHRVNFDITTSVITENRLNVSVNIWSFVAVDIYLNGEYVSCIEHPVYKPILKKTINLELKPGKNTLYFVCTALGVRDTRSVIGVQFPNMRDMLKVTLPEDSCADTVAKALGFLEGIEYQGDSLSFPSEAPVGAKLAYVGGFEPDYAVARQLVQWHTLDNTSSFAILEPKPWLTVKINTPYGELERRFERTEVILPTRIIPTPQYDDNLELILKRIAAIESLNRNGEFGFAISNILARKYLGLDSAEDEGLIRDTLALIKKRVDCSDFLMCGLIRYVHHYPMSDAMREDVRNAMLGWRYWMSMRGSDGMCFWSENHSLMFYSCAMFAGKLYPKDHFELADMDGTGLYEWGRARVIEWIEDVENNGFEEFLSAVYMCITFVALLNLVDYADAEISVRAKGITDRLLEMLAIHTWKGGFIAPMGRVYRNVLYPFSQGVMALMNLVDPAQPYDYGEGWLGFYATSSYRIPDDIRELITKNVATSYTTGNARVIIEKNDDWCLTSVACPREPYVRWENIAMETREQSDSHRYTKSVNERFHGTTDFQPGTMGYQQHLWYAALDGEAVVFANHPGAASESGDMRPGYWHGNGVFPTLKQKGNLLGMIYVIPDSQPLHYIHYYVPECRFDEVVYQRYWMFVRKGNSYIGVWSNQSLEPWTGINTHCEIRIYGNEIASICICGGSEFKTIGRFMDYCCSLNPCYIYEQKKLTTKKLNIKYIAGNDLTQYL